MANRFLSRLLGTRDPTPPDLADAQAELDALVHARPALAAPAAVLRDILGEMRQETVPAVALTADSASAKLTAGIPLLRGNPPALDGGLRKRRWVAIAAAVARRQPSEATTALAGAVRSGNLDCAALVGHVLAGHPDAIAAGAEALGLDASLVATTLRLSCLPLLAEVAADLESVRRQSTWDRGYCPICGSWPLLGEFRGLEQTRVLRCACCAASWDFPRLRCPFCDTRDHRQLGYLHTGGEADRCRAATCDACRGYVKMVASLDVLPLPRLLVADLATLHLDLAAADRGFFVA